MKDFLVYEHIFPNGKMYVGITNQKPNRRWRKGESYKCNVRMYRAIQKYGWDNIEHVILFSGLTEEEACKREVCLIRDLGLQNEKKGYNIAPGGDHPNHTEETKQKISEKAKGRKHSEKFKKWISAKNSGANNFMYGKRHTEETKKKISEKKKGSVSPNKGKYGDKNPHHRGVDLIDVKNGSIAYSFSSIVEAAEKINVCKSCIQAHLHGRQKTCAGFVWRYSDECGD